MIRLFGLGTLVALAAGLCATPAAATDCAGLARLDLGSVTALSAELAPAGPMTTPVPLAAPETLDLPAFCRVRGMVQPSIGFEVWLPTKGWNGRILSVGSAGFGGVLPLSALAEGLQRGYAVSGNDTGHQGTDPAWMKDPVKVRLWGHSATHLVTGPTKALVTAFYGAPARDAYFDGCSTGGAQAMEEAQFYPEDYDGVVAGAPGMSYAHLMLSFLWGLKASEAPGALIPPDKLQILHAAVLSACDAMDGLKDGLISDPLACRFDLASITCKAAATSTAACLTPAEALTARRIYDGPKDARTGAPLYPGFAYGSEADPASTKPFDYGWTAIQGPLAQLFAIPLLRTMVYRDPSWDWRTFDWSKDVATLDDKVGADITALSPDLQAFQGHGGKLLVYQGWGDQLNGQTLPIEYRQKVINLVSRRAPRANAERDVDGFMRLFMVPGMGHCFGGPGFTHFDALSAVRAWVEDRHAPTMLIAARSRMSGSKASDEGSRPICAFPASSHYTGSGSPLDPANFQCRKPVEGAERPQL